MKTGQQTDARGCQATITYNELGRMTRREYSGNGACGSTPDVTYSYNSGDYGIGRRTGMSDGSGTTSWGATPNDSLTQGSEALVESFGLIYFQARWLDPSLGRFSGPDTIIPNPGSALDRDRYSFVRNNPLRYIDPSGHECIPTSSGKLMCSDDFDSYEELGMIPDYEYVPSEGEDDPGNAYDIQETLDELKKLLGRPLKMEEILYMTYMAELGTVNPDDLGTLGLEGITRNLYQHCGGDPYCTQEQPISFLSEYQPWYDTPYKVNRNAYERAEELHKFLANLDPESTIMTNIRDITLNPDVVKYDYHWDEVLPNKVHQWFTVDVATHDLQDTFGYNPTDYAILWTITTEGKIFYVFTWCQDEHFNNREDDVCIPKP